MQTLGLHVLNCCRSVPRSRWCLWCVVWCGVWWCIHRSGMYRAMHHHDPPCAVNKHGRTSMVKQAWSNTPHIYILTYTSSHTQQHIPSTHVPVTCAPLPAHHMVDHTRYYQTPLLSLFSMGCDAGHTAAAQRGRAGCNRENLTIR